MNFYKQMSIVILNSRVGSAAINQVIKYFNRHVVNNL